MPALNKSSRYAPPTSGNSVLRISRSAVRLILAAAIVMPVATAALAAEQKLSPLEGQGRALAERLCARCHAVGPNGSSPHSAAPSFRTIDRRVDLDEFAARLREGLLGGHPDMPMFRFSREDARALTAYLRSIQRR